MRLAIRNRTPTHGAPALNVSYPGGSVTIPYNEELEIEIKGGSATLSVSEAGPNVHKDPPKVEA